MKKRRTLAILLCAIFANCVPAYADDLNNVKEFLSELDGNGGHFELQEIEISDSIKVLDISSIVSYEDGNGDTINFILKRNDLYKRMIQEEWFDYNYIIDNNYGTTGLSSTRVYNLNDDFSAATGWIQDGLEYEQLSTDMKLSYCPLFIDDIPYEENTELHMYEIAKDIVNSNFNTFGEYPDYYSSTPNINITYDGTKAEVSGYVRVDYEKHLFCVQFNYEHNGGGDYSYDMTYAFIEGVGASGIYVPMN